MATTMTLTTQGVRNLNDLGPKKKSRKSESAKVVEAANPEKAGVDEAAVQGAPASGEAPAPIVAS